MGLKRVHLYAHNRQSTICFREARKVACTDMPGFLRVLIDDRRGAPVHACKNCALIVAEIIKLISREKDLFGVFEANALTPSFVSALSTTERKKLFEKLSSLEGTTALSYAKQKEMRTRKGERGVWATGAPKGGRWKKTVVSAYSSGDGRKENAAKG
jgi:hypothetical protein